MYYFLTLQVIFWTSLAQMVKSLPAMQETWVRSLGWEDSLENGMATHSSALAWEIPWTEEPGQLQSMGLQSVGHDERLREFRDYLFGTVVYACP